MTQCPYCKEYGAYVSTLFVECANKECEFYSEDQRIARAEKIYKALQEAETGAEEPSDDYGIFFPDDTTDVDDVDDPDKTPVMPWGIPPLPGLDP